MATSCGRGTIARLSEKLAVPTRRVIERRTYVRDVRADMHDAVGDAVLGVNHGYTAHLAAIHTSMRLAVMLCLSHSL